MNCHFCGGKLIWGNDFSFEDYGIEGEGIVTSMTCSGCGATWEGYLEIENESIENTSVQSENN